VIFNPLAGSILAGKYKSKVPPKDGRYSDATGPIAAMYRLDVSKIQLSRVFK
jgi:aryl-alcohol dehydrogenase-like predicted oxidoreductase